MIASPAQLHSRDTGLPAAGRANGCYRRRRPASRRRATPWHACGQSSRSQRSLCALPFLSSVFRHNPSKSINVAFVQLLLTRGQLRPVVPDSAEQPPANAVADVRSQERGQCRAFIEGSTALFTLLDRALVKCSPRTFRSRFQYLVEQPGVQWAGSDGIDINLILSHLLRQRLSESHDRRLRSRIGTETWKRRCRPAAGEIDDFAVAPLAQMGQDGPAHQHRAEEIDPDRLDPLFPIILFNPSDRTVNACVIDQDCHVGECCQRSADNSLTVIRPRYIARLTDDDLSGACISFKFHFGLV